MDEYIIDTPECPSYSVLKQRFAKHTVHSWKVL